MVLFLSAGPAELPNPQFLLVNCGPLSRASPSPPGLPVEAALKFVEGAASTFKRTLVFQLSTRVFLLVRFSTKLQCWSFILVTISAQAVTSSSDLPVLTFPAFLPPDVELIKETVARNLAAKIQHVPVQVNWSIKGLGFKVVSLLCVLSCDVFVHQTSLAPQPIMTSCVIPKTTSSAAPVLLLHGFDRSKFYKI